MKILELDPSVNDMNIFPQIELPPSCDLMLFVLQQWKDKITYPICLYPFSLYINPQWDFYFTPEGRTFLFYHPDLHSMVQELLTYL